MSVHDTPSRARPVREAFAAAATPARYRASGGRRLPALALVAAIQVAAFFALGTLDVVPARQERSTPLVVNLLPLPRPQAKPETLPTSLPVRPVAVTPVERPVAPVAIVRAAAPTPPPVAVVEPPPLPVAPGPIAPPNHPVARAPVVVDDLGTALLKASPPRYPTESRRRREEGTVSLLVVVAVDGSVESLSVASSSGSDRLDEAALAAVRHWRWTQTIRGGAPVQVRGVVRIPFRLTG